MTPLAGGAHTDSRASQKSAAHSPERVTGEHADILRVLILFFSHKFLQLNLLKLAMLIVKLLGLIFLSNNLLLNSVPCYY